MMMEEKKLERICLSPEVTGVGGMASFQRKFIASLHERGIETNFAIDSNTCDAVLVVGGTKKMAPLRQAKNNGTAVVQRLDGINWIHRHSDTGLRHWIRSEYGNWILSSIRNNIATAIVYQSNFVKKWWSKNYGPSKVKDYVIYNGVDLDHFIPQAKKKRRSTTIRLLMVEGSLLGGYEFGLERAVQLAKALAERTGKELDLIIAGKVSDSEKGKWSSTEGISIDWKGFVNQDELPQLYNSADILYSADLNAACPNAVIEALACGLPVVAFDTGALGELLNEDAGRLADYGADPWKLEKPRISGLVDAAQMILENQETFRKGARARAEEAFSLESMVDAYMRVLGYSNG